MARLLRISVGVSILLSFTTAAWGVDYKVVILNPLYSEATAVSGEQQVGYGSPGYHALLWSGTPESVLDLTPSGFNWAEAWGVSGGQQVGRGTGSATGGADHALLWSGTPGSLVDLHPSGFVTSEAIGVSGGKQVGAGFFSGPGLRGHALMWSGSAGTVVDLNPDIPGIYSSASGISGDQQVGSCWGIYGDTAGHINMHAFLWSGTAESALDLHPLNGFWYSYAARTSGSQQVGGGFGPATGGSMDALLWSGTRESVVDLHPSAFEASWAYGVSDGQQVGEGWGGVIGLETHALLWSGSAASVVDLHEFVPSEYHSSRAWDIDSSGIIVGSADYHAVMWVPLIHVEIDIKPGSYPNSINLGNEGVIPVAILSGPGFNATTVDPSTIELAGAGVALRGKSSNAMAHAEDVNKDGLIDLVVQITTQNLDPGALQNGEATLTAKMYDGLFIEGSDEITIVPK